MWRQMCRRAHFLSLWQQKATLQTVESHAKRGIVTCAMRTLCAMCAMVPGRLCVPCMLRVPCVCCLLLSCTLCVPCNLVCHHGNRGARTPAFLNSRDNVKRILRNSVTLVCRMSFPPHNEHMGVLKHPTHTHVKAKLRPNALIGKKFTPHPPEGRDQTPYC